MPVTQPENLTVTTPPNCQPRLRSKLALRCSKLARHKLAIQGSQGRLSEHARPRSTIRFVRVGSPIRRPFINTITGNFRSLTIAYCVLCRLYQTMFGHDSLAIAPIARGREEIGTCRIFLATCGTGAARRPCAFWVCYDKTHCPNSSRLYLPHAS